MGLFRFLFIFSRLGFGRLDISRNISISSMLSDVLAHHCSLCSLIILFISGGIPPSLISNFSYLSLFFFLSLAKDLSLPKKKKKTKQQNTKEGRRRAIRHTENSNKMARASPSPSVITVNVNGLNSPSKRHTLTEWI